MNIEKRRFVVTHANFPDEKNIERCAKLGVVADGGFDLVFQRAGIANAGGAAVTNQVKAERIEIFLCAGLGEVFGHYF